MGDVSPEIFEVGSGCCVGMPNNLDRSSYTIETMREHVISNILDRRPTCKGGDCCGGMATCQLD